jgi:hypothetical protein
MSPILFNVMMNEICNRINKNERNKFKSFYIYNDIMIWGEDVKELETRLTHWERISKEY